MAVSLHLRCGETWANDLRELDHALSKAGNKMAPFIIVASTAIAFAMVIKPAMMITLPLRLHDYSVCDSGLISMVTLLATLRGIYPYPRLAKGDQSGGQLTVSQVP